MNIIQLYEEKENQNCFEFLENKIREASRQMIEKIYSEEVQLFLDRTSSIVDEQGRKLVVRNGWNKERTVQTSSGNITVKLPRVDDRKSTEKFISKILPPFVRKTPTVETLIAALYLAGVSSNKFQDALSSVFGEDSKGFSPATIIRMTKDWLSEFQEWKKTRSFRKRICLCLGRWSLCKIKT